MGPPYFREIYRWVKYSNLAIIMYYSLDLLVESDRFQKDGIFLVGLDPKIE